MTGVSNFSLVPEVHWAATSPTTLQFTQPKVDKPKSLLWWAKPLKTKLICENKQRVAPFRESWSRAILGEPPFGHSALWKRKKKLCPFCFVKKEEEASPTLVLGRDQTTRSTQNMPWSEHPPFWVSETHSAAHARTWVYESLCVRSSLFAAQAGPTCKRSQPDRVWSLQIRSDHRPHTLGQGRVPLPCS